MGRCGNYQIEIQTSGEGGKRWKDVGIIRERIPSRGEVGERWENVGIT